MGEIFVLVEHRQGKIRDITYEMLGAGRETSHPARDNIDSGSSG